MNHKKKKISLNIIFDSFSKYKIIFKTKKTRVGVQVVGASCGTMLVCLKGNLVMMSRLQIYGGSIGIWGYFCFNVSNQLTS